MSDGGPRSAVNLSVPEEAVEAYHRIAKYSDAKRRIEAGVGPDVSISYGGDKLDPDQVELVERWAAYRLWEPVELRDFFE